jgi:methionyl-tRNA formyltransferase
VLTQPDRPAGRGQQYASSPVKRFAKEQGLALLQPSTLKSAEAIACIKAARADAIVVAAYGLILPEPLLNATAHGALNIHASLLPRWRGAAPIQRALLAGDLETGISIMKMDRGLDTGPVVAWESIPIAAEDDAGSLHGKLAALGARMIVAALEDVGSGKSVVLPQSESLATYARKISKAETVLDWSRPADELERAVRAFRPSPGASTTLGGDSVKVWRASERDERGEPGVLLRVDDGALVIGCARRALAVTEIQRPGGRRLTTAEFLRGHALKPGTRFR